MKLDLTSVQQLLKDKKEASYEFENGDVLLIAEKDGDFSGIGELNYIQVGYGVKENHFGTTVFMATNTQFFSLNDREEAIQCFLSRLNSTDPISYFGKQYTLQEVKERN